MEIRFQKVSYMAVMVLSFMILSGCNGGGSTVPSSLTAGTTPPVTTGGPTQTQTQIQTPAPAPAPAGTGTATVSWAAPLSRVSGTAISMAEIGGYKIYYGTSSTDTSNVVDVPGAQTTERQITGLTSGTYYFRVSVYDTQKVESPKSPVMSKQIL